MNFKYQKEIDAFKGFDFSVFSANERDCFRWVFADIKDHRNFKPKFLLDPTVPRDKCIGWALSFFETKEKALTRLNRLTRNKEFLFKKLGTHIANGQLSKYDGISNNADKLGHFSLFEYKGVDLMSKFTVVEQIAN